MSIESELGRVYHATVDGQDCTVYLSLRCEGKGNDRRDHCYRYGPPSHAIVDKGAEVVLGEPVHTVKGWGLLDEDKRYTVGNADT